MITDIDADQLASRYQSAQPFPHICIPQFLEPSVAREIAASYPDY